MRHADRQSDEGVSSDHGHVHVRLGVFHTRSADDVFFHPNRLETQESRSKVDGG